MDDFNQKYWNELWHNDFELHKKLCIKNVTPVGKSEHTSIYADTDSCDKDTLIRTNNGTLTIEDWYNENIINGSGGSTLCGHESVLTNDEILNYSDDNNIYYAKVKRIIRHQVSKPKWKLKTKSGKEIIVTNDHSMIVFRNGVKLEIKPSEILETDKILVLKNDIEYILDDIESCEQIGSFDNEYVYDVEVDDESHTFIANDILVHNSLFVSFEPALNHCDWKNLFIDKLETAKKKFIFLESRQQTTITNSNCIGYFRDITTFKEFLKNEKPEMIIIDGYFVKDRDLNSKEVKDLIGDIPVYWNWDRELDFIHGMDYFRYAKYFKDCLEDYAKSYGVKNREDFELERVSESIINIAKKKYIQHIVYEDGIPYDRLSYIFPKGVELVRSSTPAFAREKIVEIVKYLFEHPDDFNIKDLLKLVKKLRKEFELADIDDISMQSSCSNYETKVLEDKTRLEFVSGAHFAVKSAAYYNFLLHQRKDLQSKYEFIKSGTKIKYYHCKNKKINDMFAFIRGSYPIEIAPEVDYDMQFFKSIISPINSIIEPLGLPEITTRLSVIVDIFGKF